MKKWMAVLLSLAMLFTIAAAAAETYTAQDCYTVDYPDTLTLDDESYVDTSTEDNVWLFLLAGDDYMIDAELAVVEGYEGFSLYGATGAQKAAYIAEALSTFADYDPTLMDILESQSGIPFYVYSLLDGNGVRYYYAETITNGVSVYFCCYYFDVNTPPDAALLRSLENVLLSFRPAGEDAEENDA